MDKKNFTPAPKAPETRAVKLNEGSAKARRSAARLAAVQVLYQADLNDQSPREAMRDFLQNRNGFEFDGDIFVPANPELLEKIIDGVIDRRDDLDTMIAAQLAKKDKETTEPILNAILVAAAYEIMAHHDTDTPIIISDYMNVAHAFYEDGAPKMINAILDSLAKSLR